MLLIKKAKSNLITGDKAEQTIQQIQKRLKQGECFAALAKQYSEDPISAAKGGIIGTFNPDVFGADGAKVAKAIEGLIKIRFQRP